MWSDGGYLQTAVFIRSQTDEEEGGENATQLSVGNVTELNLCLACVLLRTYGSNMAAVVPVAGCAQAPAFPNPGSLPETAATALS